MSLNIKTKISLILFIVSGFLGALGFRLSVPIIAFYSREVLGVPVIIISSIFVGFMGARGVMAIVSGYIMDIKPRYARFIPVFAFLTSLVILCYILVKDWSGIIALRVLQGILSGCLWPVVQFLVASLSPREVKGRILSLYFISGSLAVFLANIVYALIFSYPLWLQLFIPGFIYILCGLTLTLSLMTIRGMDFKKTMVRGGTLLSTHKSSSGNLIYTAVIGGFALSFMTCYVFGDLSYIYVSETLNIGKSVTALLLAYAGVLGIMVSYLLGWASDKYSNKKTIIVTLLLAMISVFLVSCGNMYTFVLGLILAAIAAKGYRPITKRLLAIYSSLPALGIAAIDTSMNFGLSLGQIFFGGVYDTYKSSVIHVNGLTVYIAPLSLLILLPLVIYVMIKLSKA